MAKKRSKEFLTRHRSIGFFFAYTSDVGAIKPRADQTTTKSRIHATFWKRQACLPVREKFKLAVGSAAVIEHAVAAREQREATQQHAERLLFSSCADGGVCTRPPAHSRTPFEDLAAALD